ncbi:2'-5' RNA ligase family protein [Halorussus gelatinilyticus]|uniref:2'-5' RNA ligase family protein n=1 Tax=Halorussus gelatinilyticus TaxID=2937524 RepID=A0A8U0ILY1_9EURY|nr:2'-5' RNA ligase family protein [Halorussus gelatinilyticus]UPW01665.1 2'-5' RNA ligase family protein [Halorussus gelatinilyticus]
MYSLNVPVPGEVERLAEDLRPALLDFESIRERHTLLCKRLGDEPPGGTARLREQLRTRLAGAPAFEARVTGIDRFENPPLGEGPVVYLAVESPGLRQVHGRLLDEFSAVEEFEGDDYVPHVTLARGGGVAAEGTARRLADREIEPVTWTVNRLALWDATYEEEVATFSLPG